MAEQNNLKENTQRPKKIQYKNDPTNNRGNQNWNASNEKKTGREQNGNIQAQGWNSIGNYGQRKTSHHIAELL